jgi:hypothetical protein
LFILLFGGKKALSILGPSDSYHPRDSVEVPVKAGQSPNIPLATGQSNQPIIEIQFPGSNTFAN